jgi:transposase
VPALPSSILEPLWVQVAALLPSHKDTHPLGCHRPRIPDRVIFDKLIQILVFGCGYRRIADHSCSATTLRRRRDDRARHDPAHRGSAGRRPCTTSSLRLRVRAREG